MATPTSAYWASLANTYVIAYARLFGISPSKHAVLFAMTVAEHETRNGRAWPGCNNFGGVQLRRLTTEERAAFDAGTLKAGARLAGNPGGELHVDTTPTAHGNVAYPVWFAAFPTVIDGVTYFLKILLKGRPACRVVVDSPSAPLADLATMMYVTGYYEGFHAGGRPLGKRSLPLLPAEQANVDDYTKALERNLVTLTTGLGPEWEANGTLPGRVSESVPVPPFVLTTIKGYQAALTFLAIRTGHPAFDPRGIDGIHGAGTDAAVKAFQTYAAIHVDGDVGPQTISKLREVLTMAGVSV